LALGILGLIQTVGIEEECGAWCERCLLLGHTGAGLK
jgi:hypothetical protein